MIRLAAMTSIFPDWTLDEAILALQRHGYDGLEARVEWKHKAGIGAELSSQQRADVRGKVEGAGLRICAVASGVQVAEESESKRAQHMKDLHAYIDLAADLGAGIVRTFGGPRPRDRELKYVIDYMVEAYQGTMAHATDRGVTVLLETHDEWCHSSEVRAVVERVNDPCLRVLWDIIHPQRLMETPKETFASIGHLTCHVHGHDGVYPEGGKHVRITGLGEGVFDHATPLRMLDEAGFEGYFSVEVIHASGSQHDADGVLRQYAQAFRKMMGR